MTLLASNYKYTLPGGKSNGSLIFSSLFSLLTLCNREKERYWAIVTLIWFHNKTCTRATTFPRGRRPKNPSHLKLVYIVVYVFYLCSFLYYLIISLQITRNQKPSLKSNLAQELALSPILIWCFILTYQNRCQ